MIKKNRNVAAETQLRTEMERDLGLPLLPDHIIKLHQYFKRFNLEELTKAFEISYDEYFIEGVPDPYTYVDILIDKMGGIANNRKRYGDYVDNILYIVGTLKKKNFVFNKSVVMAYLARNIKTLEDANKAVSIAQNSSNWFDFCQQLDAEFGNSLLADII